MLEAETGRRVSAPPPMVWCNGKSQKKELGRARRKNWCVGGGRRPGGVGDAGMLEAETGEEAFCPLRPRSSVMGRV